MQPMKGHFLETMATSPIKVKICWKSHIIRTVYLHQQGHHMDSAFVVWTKHYYNQ